MTDRDTLPGNETARIPVTDPVVTVRMYADFMDMKDEVTFSYQSGNQWLSFGSPHKLYFMLDHFTGCRAGLFLYSTETTGGGCTFSDFIFETPDVKGIIS